MTDSAAFNDFTKVLSGQVSVVKKLIRLERELTKTASHDDTQKLDVLVKEAQPDLYSFRSLEKKRVQLAEKLGWKDLRSSQILSLVSEEEKSVLSPLFEDLKEALEILKESQESAERIMHIRLNDVNAAISSHQIPKAFQDTLA
jgi:DNA primase large subunit